MTRQDYEIRERVHLVRAGVRFLLSWPSPGADVPPAPNVCKPRACGPLENPRGVPEVALGDMDVLRRQASSLVARLGLGGVVRLTFLSDVYPWLPDRCTTRLDRYACVGRRYL